MKFNINLEKTMIYPEHISNQKAMERYEGDWPVDTNGSILFVGYDLMEGTEHASTEF